ncbi:MAG: hypothetical protein NTV89_18340 [Proteobacteria bacterium]|nr:hypothetical protein [Pseudomonadota bacterium]
MISIENYNKRDDQLRTLNIIEQKRKVAQIIHVNMSDLKADVEDLSENYLLLGGRWLIANIMNNGVALACDPNGDSRRLVSRLLKSNHPYLLWLQ